MSELSVEHRRTTSRSNMIDTSSWDQSFVDTCDDDRIQFACLGQRSPSERDSPMAAVEGGPVASRDWLSNGVFDGPHPRRRKTPKDIVVGCPLTSMEKQDRQPIDVRCTVTSCSSASGTELYSKQGRPGAARLDAVEFKKSSRSRDRLYENTPCIVGSLSTVEDENDSLVNMEHATSCAGQIPMITTAGLLLPVGGIVRKASSCSSTSSACDSVLELCTASSRCSSCSDPIVPLVVTPVGEAPSLPDSGNGSVEHFRFSVDGSDSKTGTCVVSDLHAPVRKHPRGRSEGSFSPSYSLIASFLPEWDAERLETVYGRLMESGFYYGRLSIDSAAERLHRASVGQFLLRDSADGRYLFSISVQTFRGTTSIRVMYRSGLFRLDCSPEQEHLMPTFDCALRLVQYYVRICSDRRRSRSSSYVFLESSGRRDTPVLLRTPLYRRVHRLTHLCRRAVHWTLSRGPGGLDPDRASVVDRLQLIPTLKYYLKDYPYEL